MARKLQTIGEFRKYLINELISLYPPEEADSVATLVIMTATGLNRLQQFTKSDFSPEDQVAAKLLLWADELKTGKPVQYVTGETEFAGCRITVNRHTLIPRPETEEMVMQIIKDHPGFRGVITEFATGSGCIAIALAKHFPEADVYASDISAGALDKAAENAILNRVKVSFSRFDLLKDQPPAYKSDIIVCNPPYVTLSEKKLMHKNVLDFEPHSALFVPDNDPMLFYRAVAGHATAALSSNGKLYVEINERFSAETCAELEKRGFKNNFVNADINGRKRFIKSVKDA